METSTIKTRIKNLLRSPSVKLKRNRQTTRGSPADMLTLERVLGVTTSGSSGLTCDPCSGAVAYPAGCVVVLLNPRKNKQQHIINTSRKTITTLAFSSDGKYLVTGESGHLPAVRVWDVSDGSQVAELQEHKYGVACVAFSPNSKYIVSVGSQHDMSVNVWVWKKNMLVAANKVSCKVTAVAFSEDSSYFVTAGNRHVRFWYLEPCNLTKPLTAPVPLLGRSGLLGEQQNNFFCDVACGRGEKSESTFCLTLSGLLCEFNEKRMLDKWVDLRTSTAHALTVSEELIFCACADGTVRVFSSSDLRFICTLPLPHHLSTDMTTVTQASNNSFKKSDARYPDSLAVTFDPVNLWLSCVYSDHSLYVWDVQDLQRVGKVHSALYHAACVWDLQMYPKATEGSPTELCTAGQFFTCSADNTIRMWSTEPHNNSTDVSILSNDLHKVIYTESNTTCLLDRERTAGSNTEKPEVQTAESRTGIRSICISPDGKHLASGDRNGTLRVHDLNSMEEILKAEVHDSEILCLEYSKPETGLKLLATAGRDRLIHVLDVEEDYSVLQTLDEHSSITAVRFAANEGKVRLVSCGADKSIYFRTAHRTFRGVKFKRTHHVVRKSTLYDMDVDPTCKYAAVGCQDRRIRVFNISSGKQKKYFKGSFAEDGSLLRVQIDPSGLYVATSCSDKNINLFDFRTGECLAAVFGHSENITGIKFTSDCRHLISVSGDSCIFIWRLAPELTINMRERLDQLKRCQIIPALTHSVFRRDSTSSLELHSTLSLPTCSTESDEAEDHEDEDRFGDIQTPDENDIHQKSLEDEQGASDEAHDWDSSIKPQESCTGTCGSEPSLPQVPHKRKRWNCRMGSLDLMVKSMLELRQLDSFSRPNSPKRGHLSNQASGSTASLKANTVNSLQCNPHSAWLSPASSPEPEGVVLYPVLCPSTDFQSEACQLQRENVKCHDSPSRDSGGSAGYGSGGSSPEQGSEGSDNTEPLSIDEEHYTQEEEDKDRGKSFHKPESLNQERFLKQHSRTMAEINKGQKPRPRSSISASFFAQGSTTSSPSRSFSKTGRKSKRGPSCVFKPQYIPVHPMQEDKSQEQGLEEKTETNLPDLLGSTPKRRKSNRVQEVNPISKWRVKSMSTHSLLAESSQKSVTSSYLKRESYPPVSELPTEKSDAKIQSRHSSSTESPSAHLWDSPNTQRRFKNRSYMNPTTSFKAKVCRSVSLGEGLHLNLPTGQTTPSTGSCQSPTSPSDASTPLLPSPSSPLPGPCNQGEPELSHGGSQTSPVKINKTHVLSRTSLSSSPVSHSEPVKGNPEALSYTKQHPLVAVQAYNVMHESQTDQAKTSVNLETCRQAAAELYSSIKKATQLFGMMNSDAGDKGTEQQEMGRVLVDALFMARSELEAVPGLCSKVEPMGSSEGEDKTLALLEQYSELLLQSVKKKLEDKI
ncbi:mitogen-activated protein kinase-binding protein 1-like [Trichomycterus rosablanca]|uniref:mitogen-activated protein kinase-binding protein 1-like n=1 Tax=Trichomycterus rosablanca TaxID=2290929 RepID=UPI002F35C3BF